MDIQKTIEFHQHQIDRLTIKGHNKALQTSLINNALKRRKLLQDARAEGLTESERDNLRERARQCRFTAQDTRPLARASLTLLGLLNGLTFRQIERTGDPMDIRDYERIFMRNPALLGVFKKIGSEDWDRWISRGDVTFSDCTLTPAPQQKVA